MMSVNNNNPQKNPNYQFQTQKPGGTGIAGHNQLSQYAAAHEHAQAIAQAQSKAQAQILAQAQAQAQAQAAHAKFQAHLQSQGLSLNQPPVVLNSSSPSFPGSGSAGAKRPPQKLGRPPGTTNANMLLPLRSMEVTPATRKKKQKLPDKHWQERVAAILPQSALYSQLLEFESHVDAALARKKIDIQDAIKNPPCMQRTLRIYVFNTFANQVRTIPKNPNAEPPSWTLKIVGRILEEGMDPDQDVLQKTNPLYPKFSSFLKKVTITLDQRLYPDSNLIVWDSAKMPVPQEGFEVRRKGDKEFTVNLRLEMNYNPEKFKVSPVLMEVIGTEVETRPRIIAGIWNYVKVRKLQNADDPMYFTCDLTLQKVFGEEKVKCTTVSQKISQHLSPPQPIHLEHRIKLSGNSPAGNACYDVLVDVPFTINRELNALLSNTEKTKEIEACDEGICSIIRKIQEHRKRRAFFLGFSQSPVEFIDALVESQGRDLNLLAGETSHNAEKERRFDFYNQPWVEDAVIRYVNRKPPPPPAAAPPST